MLVPFVLFGLISTVRSCTTLAFGKAATVDGSPMVTYNVDAGSQDFRLAHIPSRDHAPEAMRPVYAYQAAYPRYVGNRSSVYAPQKSSGGVMQETTSAIGHIPQVSHTYAYWEGPMPIMNEKGVVFGESTCFAKIAVPRLGAGGTAMFFVHELMQIALERCSTARCAVSTMGYWAETEGFYGEDPEQTVSGEVLTVADSSEAWVFHVMPEFHGGAVWAAQRVPDTHAAVAANNFIIREIDFSDDMHANFFWSNNTLTVAKQLVDRGESPAFCTKAATFDFLKCFGADLRTDVYDPGYGAKIPDPFYTTLRMWRVHNVVAPSSGFALPTDNAFDLPFSFPVDAPVTLQQIMDLKRDTYRGTEYDLGKDVLAGPYEDPNRNEGGNGMLQTPGKWARAISIIRTSCSIIGQTGKHAPGHFWYTMHQPATSVYVPVFVEATECHDSYMRGSQLEYDRTSAWWIFSFVSNWMRLAWKEIGDTFVFPRLHQLQAEVIDRAGKITSNLTAEQVTLQGDVVAEWARLGDFLVMAANNGYFNNPELAGKFGYPKEWLDMIGFNQSIIPRTVMPEHSNTEPAPHSQNRNPAATTAGIFGFMSGLLIGAVGMFFIASTKLLQSRKVNQSDYAPLVGA